MNIPSSPLKENLTVFFNDCEDLLARYNLQGFRGCKVKYKFRREKGLSHDLRLGIAWPKVRKLLLDEVKTLESINPCVDNLIEFFGIADDATVQYGVSTREEKIEANRNLHKWELAYLFFEYKRLQEEFILSVDDFITLLKKQLGSEYGYCKATAQLIGLKTTLEEIKIGDFTIRKPTEDELNRIINDQEIWSISKISEPFDMVFGNFEKDNCFWAFTETRENLLNNVYCNGLLSQRRKINLAENNNDVVANFKKLILALRLHKGNCIGIRSLFVRKSLNPEGNDFEPWIEFPFLDVAFGKFERTSFLHKFDLLGSEEILSAEANEINILFKNLNLYDSNPLEQIDRALDHFFKAFEQNYPVYTFTELIMSLETILLENVKTNPDEKLNLIRRIREADNVNDGFKILKEYEERNSITKAINLLNQLLNPGKKNKRLNKFFLDYKNNGCYKIRNDLIHGNIELDFAEIRKKIPDLEEYVRSALLKIIDLRISNELNCNEENYFEKLNEILKT